MTISRKDRRHSRQELCKYSLGSMTDTAILSQYLSLLLKSDVTKFKWASLCGGPRGCVYFWPQFTWGYFNTALSVPAAEWISGKDAVVTGSISATRWHGNLHHSRVGAHIDAPLKTGHHDLHIFNILTHQWRFRCFYTMEYSQPETEWKRVPTVCSSSSAVYHSG